MFKKASSRSILSNNPKLKYLQAVYSWKIFNFLNEGAYLVNVDECSISKSLRTHYSWLSKGKGAPIINTNCKGNANVIFALGCDGEWIWAIYNNSSTAERFSQFLMILKAYALLVLDRTEDELKIILDNATIHVATKTKRAAFYLELEVHWLPQYSPELAPVELVFGMAKRRLASILNGKSWL